MKGVLLDWPPWYPDRRCLPHNITAEHPEGAFVLAGIVDSFPAGTVHLVVIDPAVGFDRG